MGNNFPLLKIATSSLRKWKVKKQETFIPIKIFFKYPASDDVSINKILGI